MQNREKSWKSKSYKYTQKFILVEKEFRILA